MSAAAHHARPRSQSRRRQTLAQARRAQLRAQLAACPLRSGVRIVHTRQRRAPPAPAPPRTPRPRRAQDQGHWHRAGKEDGRGLLQQAVGRVEHDARRDRAVDVRLVRRRAPGRRRAPLRCRSHPLALQRLHTAAPAWAAPAPSHHRPRGGGVRRSQEYPVAMSNVWKRVNESGKNWRIVYKALTLLEYLIRNGSERAVEDGRSPPVEDAPLALGPSSPRPARPACRSHVPQSAAPAARPLVAGLRFAR